jgi:tRNA(Ile)-lysidine synthase
MLLKKAESTIKKYGMLSEGEMVLIGVSGGSDSVFLLHLLNHLKEKYQLSLHVAHLNHGFRKEAEKEAKFVKGMAESLGIPSTLKTIDVPSYAKKRKLSKQEAAREVRYSFLKDVANKISADKIALGHTADDQAETFLMRMIRGSGARGMGGINPYFQFTDFGELSRAVHSSLVTVIRPLIETGRKEIMDYLKKKGIPFIEDPSNISKVYLRNRIRNELIPYIEKRYNPQIKEIFVHSAQILREEDSFLENYSKRILPEFVTLREKGRAEISLNPFLNLDKAIQRRIIRIIIEGLKGVLKGFSMKHINEVLESIATGQTGRKINLPKGVVIQRDYNLLTFFLKNARRKTQDSRLKTYNVNIRGVTKIPELGLTLHAEIKESHSDLGDGRIKAAFDLEKINDNIMIRGRKEGDYFLPFGMGGKSKKLKTYFIDEKIRRDERERIPLLVSGDNILWVIGHRQDDRYKVSEGTKKALLIKAERGIHDGSR